MRRERLARRVQTAVADGYAGLAGLTVLLLAAPLVLRNNYHYDVALKIELNAILAVGLNLLIGYAGQISLGHAAFFGIGAYAAAILTSRFHVDGVAALAIGAIGAGALAFV